MKVILNQDIKGVGKKDEVINASDGYAKNYLLPRKLATIADADNMAKLKAKQDSKNHKKDLEKEEAVKIQAKLKELTLKISAKTGDNGKLFGSITSKEISENLKQQYEIEIDKKKIVADPIKELGVFTVDIKIYEGVIGKLKVLIEKTM